MTPEEMLTQESMFRLSMLESSVLADFIEDNLDNVTDNEDKSIIGALMMRLRLKGA